MDLYHWKADEPGDIQGVVIAENGLEAKRKVIIHLAITHGYKGRTPEDIVIEWLGPANDDVYILEEL